MDPSVLPLGVKGKAFSWDLADWIVHRLMGKGHVLVTGAQKHGRKACSGAEVYDFTGEGEICGI